MAERRSCSCWPSATAATSPARSNFIGADALYGRNWGALEEHPFLHFEVCYYQAIDFAIARRLARVEAGAQGEHKLARGYLPVPTYSAHWIADRGPAARRRRLSQARAPRGSPGDCSARRGVALPQGRLKSSCPRNVVMPARADISYPPPSQLHLTVVTGSPDHIGR